MKHENFDERQLQIRGDAFRHGFLAAVFTLGINAVLNNFGIVWAEGFHQNILILMLIVTIVSMEFILRGAYFGKDVKPGLISGIFVGCSACLIILNIKHFIDGEVYIENGMLARGGGSLIMCILVTINACTGLIQYFRNKNQERNG